MEINLSASYWLMSHEKNSLLPYADWSTVNTAAGDTYQRGFFVRLLQIVQ